MKAKIQETETVGNSAQTTQHDLRLMFSVDPYPADVFQRRAKGTRARFNSQGTADRILISILPGLENNEKDQSRHSTTEEELKIAEEERKEADEGERSCACQVRHCLEDCEAAMRRRILSRRPKSTSPWGHIPG